MPSTGLAGEPATSTDSIVAPGGSDDLHERLRAVAHPQRDLGQRAPFLRDERRRDGALGDRRQHRRVGEARDVQRERRRAGRTSLIAVRREQRLPRSGGERRVDLAHVHAPQPGNIFGT